jgi:hypothetical protein
MPTRCSSIFLWLLIVASGLTLPASPAGAQTATLQQRLAATTALTCTFSAVVTGGWDRGTAGAKTGTAKLEVAFANVNVDEGTADAAGIVGKSFIAVRYANDYLHLMQMHSAGPLYTTTVLAREAKDGRLMAVHTRHEYTQISLPGFTSRPEMYLGDCALGK